MEREGIKMTTGIKTKIVYALRKAEHLSTTTLYLNTLAKDKEVRWWPDLKRASYFETFEAALDAQRRLRKPYMIADYAYVSIIEVDGDLNIIRDLAVEGVEELCSYMHSPYPTVEEMRAQAEWYNNTLPNLNKK
jgi:hypothetical protein